MAVPSMSSPFLLREPPMTGAGRGLFCCCSSFRSWTSSRFLLEPLLKASVVTVSGSGMSMGAGGGTALVIALALALALGLVAATGCSEGGTGVAVGWAGAAFTRMTGGAGAAISTPFVVEALSAVTAARADAMNAYFPIFFKPSMPQIERARWCRLVSPAV